MQMQSLVRAERLLANTATHSVVLWSLLSISVSVRPASNSLQQDAGTLLICVPLWKVHLNSEALSQEVQHLAPCDAALLHDQTEHFSHAFLVEGVVFSALDQLLVDLEVCEVHQSLDASARG